MSSGPTSVDGCGEGQVIAAWSQFCEPEVSFVVGGCTCGRHKLLLPIEVVPLLRSYSDAFEWRAVLVLDLTKNDCFRNQLQDDWFVLPSRREGRRRRFLRFRVIKESWLSRHRPIVTWWKTGEDKRAVGAGELRFLSRSRDLNQREADRLSRGAIDHSPS